MQLVDPMQLGGAKVKYQLGFLDKWAPYFDSLKPLGLRCSVVCVMCVMWGGWGPRDSMGWGAPEGMHFSQ